MSCTSVSLSRCLRMALFTALFFGLGISSAVADDSDDCTVRAVTGGVECVTADGTPKWDTHHPALWPTVEAYLDGEDGARPVGPVTIDETAFYAIARDLLAVDLDDGVIEDRARFPDAIADLVAPGDGTIDVELQAAGMALLQALGPQQELLPSAPRPRSQPRVVTHQPGTPPPAPAAPSLADILGQVATSHDAQRLLASAGSNPEAIDLLQSARATDPTNPFLSQLLGTVLEDSGDNEAAIRAFSQAVDNPDAPWQDLLHLSSLLDGSIAPDKADEALRRGLQQMGAVGIDPENLANFLPMVTTILGDSDDLAAIMAALDSGDIDEAIRLGMEVAEHFPDADRLQEKWQQIGAENEAAAYDIGAEVLSDLDRLALIFGTAALSLILLVFLVGMRIGETRQFRILDVVIPAVLLAVLVAIPYQLNTHAQVAEEVASIPIAELQGGIDSPEGQQWLLSMAENPDVQQMLTSIFRDEASVDTEEIERVPLLRLLVDSAYADAEQTRWDPLKRGQMPDLVAALQMLDDDASEFQAPGEMSLAYALILVVLLLLLAAIGVLIGRKAPGVAHPVLRAVPGGSSTLPPLGALTLCAFVAAVAALFGFDTVVQQLAIPEIQQQLDIDDVDRLASTPSRLWAWVTLVAAIAVQIGIAAWDISR